MHNRFDVIQAPELYQAASQLQAAIEATGVDKKLFELIKIRASQINGCAFCINMHTLDARKLGISEQRIYLLSAWRESTVYDARERALLAWTEALTLVSQHGAPQGLYEELKQHFSDQEVLGITAAIAMINFWNRVAIGSAKIHPSEKREQ